MAKKKRPTPKSQRKISEDQHQPYEVEGMRGGINQNPNDADYDPDNRGNHTTLRGDTTKPLTISLMDIDEAVHYYMEHIIKPYVIQNGERVEVPILYGSAERWKQVQKDGVLRDKGNKLMLPVILYKRTSIDPNRSLTNKLDANFPRNYNVFEKSYSPKNKYDNFNVLTNRKPEKEYHAVVVPDYVTLNYDFIISTHYVEQMNKIIEAINYASDSYWGDPERFKFKAILDSFVNAIELPVDGQRVVKTTFSIKLHGYIVPEALQKDLASIKKFSNKTKLVFGLETTDWDEELSSVTGSSTKYGTTVFPGKASFSPVKIYENNILVAQKYSGESYYYSSLTPAVSISINDNLTDALPPGNTTFNFNIVDTTGTTVSASINSSSNSEIEVEVESGFGYVAYNRPYLEQTSSLYDYDEGWRKINGANTYNDNVPDGVATQMLEPDLVNTRYDYLRYNNVWGHKFRFTGVSGGYYDESDGNYYLSDGTLSDKSGAYPTSSESSQRWLVIDHLTGFANGNERILGTQYWTSSLEENVNYDFYGEGVSASWFSPSVAEYRQYYINGTHGWNAIRQGGAYRPFFTYAQSDYWTSTVSSNSPASSFFFRDGYGGGLAQTSNTTGKTYAQHWYAYYSGFINQPSFETQPVYYNRPHIYQTISYNDYDTGYRVLNGANDYRESIPTSGLVQQIEPDTVNGRVDYLKYYNIWGHKFRFTGLTGGYYDEADGNYYTKDGVLSDKATEFPFVVSTRALIVDHLTGLMYKSDRDGATTWTNAMDDSVINTDGGYTDWITVSQPESLLLSRNDINQFLYDAERPPFNMSQTLHWLGDTRISLDTQADRLQVASYQPLSPGTKTGTGANRFYQRVHLTGTIPQP